MSDYQMSAEIIGAKELKEAFKKAPEVTARELKNAVGDAMNDLRNIASNSAPHRTGALQGSIHSQGPFATSNNVHATVGSNLKYAPYQEYGTQPHIILAKNKKALANTQTGQFFGRRVFHPGFPGRFYFKKAIESVRPKFTEYISRAVGRIIDALKG